MSYKKTILTISFLAVFGFLFCLNIPTAKAVAVEEFQTLISTLLAQIASFQQQLAQLQGGTAVWCHDFNVNLRYGDSGTEVKALQTALEKEGFRIAENEKLKSYFGDFTASAVVGFQEKYASKILTHSGLKRGTGYVGHTTRVKLNQLYGCRPTPIPSITVTSPNEREAYKVGDTVSVTWNAFNVPSNATVALQLSYNLKGSTLEDVIISSLSPYTDRYAWTIPAKYAQSGMNPSLFKMRGILHYNNVHVEDYSDAPFSIVSSRPSITVISPNGGERWALGSTQTIRWSSQNTSCISLDLVNSSGALVVNNLVNLTGNPGSASWAIPTYIQPGQYWMRVGTCSNSVVNRITTGVDPVTIYDISDAPFSIEVKLQQEEPESIEEQLEKLEKQLKEEIKIESLEPYKMIKKDVVFQGYMEENVGEGTEYYYEYQGKKLTIENIPVGENKYGVISYNISLKILDPNTDEYKLISDLGTSGSEVEVFGHKDDLIVKWSYYNRFGCCSMPIHDNIFIYNLSSGESISKEIEYEDMPGRESLERSFSLFLIEDKLYLKATNEFYYSITVEKRLFGVGVDRYYLLASGKITEKKDEFGNIYLKKVIEYEKILREENWQNNDWLSPLLWKILNLTFAGEENRAWKEFFEDFAKFSEKYPLEEIEKIDPDRIKKGIQRQLGER